MKRLSAILLTIALFAAACQLGDRLTPPPTQCDLPQSVGAEQCVEKPLSDYLRPLTAAVVDDIAWYLDNSYLDYAEVQAAAADDLRLRAVAARIDSLSLGQQYLLLYRAFNQFNDAHTYFSLNRLNESSLPIIFERIERSFVIINSTSEWRHLIGQRIVSIDGCQIDDWYRRACDLAAADNDYGRSRRALDVLHRPLVYALYDEVVKDSLLIETEAFSGLLDFSAGRRPQQFLANDYNNLRLGSNTIQLFKIAARDPYGYRLDDEAKIITIYFNSLSQLASADLVAFGESLRHLIESRLDYGVAFDFRTCLGGSAAALSTAFSADFLQSISDRACSYVSRNSMSAGTLLPAQLRHLFGFKIIGEMTPYSEHTAYVSATADKYRIDAVDAAISSSFSNGGYRARLAEPALCPDYLISPQLADYIGQTDSWQVTFRREILRR